MNRRQKRNLLKKNLRESARKKSAITYSRESTSAEQNTDCKPCRYFEICMERRGRCRDFEDYEAIKQKVRVEIENLRKGTDVV